MCLPIVPEGKSSCYLFEASSDLKFKNTALGLNASIVIRKELDSLCGRNIGSQNISTYKYSKSKPDMDKKSVHVHYNTIQ